MTQQGKTEKPEIKTEPAMEGLVIGGARYTTRLNSKFANRPFWKRPDNRKVVAVIPGTIQKIMVAEGDEVSQGSPLLILEAMKMRNEVRSPVEGRIEKIYVSEGEQVSKAYLLLEFA